MRIKIIFLFIKFITNMSNYKQLEIPFEFEEEEFKDIENYEGLYQVSNYGRVYSLISKKFLKTCKNNKNYLVVTLCKNGKKKNYQVHRLVAQAFLENPLNYKEVNHKDENPSNNHLENLEWCSASYNINYGSRTERMMQNPNYKATRKKCGVPKKPVLQFTRQGEFVKEYPSTCEAERQTKIASTHISSCCNGSRKSCGGFVWRFKDVS
jgi:hypothetical protein